MNKKIVTFVASAVLAATCLFAFAGCTPKDEPSKTRHSLTTDEASAFIGRVLERAEIPVMAGSFAVSLTGDNTANMQNSSLAGSFEQVEDYVDYVKYKTFLTDFTGVEGIVVSESMMMSTFRLIYLSTTAEGDEAALAKTLLENADLSHLICMTAEEAICLTLDNDVILFMFDTESCDAIYNAVLAEAEGVFTNIGTKQVKTA